MKVELLQNRYKGKVDVCAIADLASGDYTEALEGVGAVIHVASPAAGKDNAKAMIQVSNPVCNSNQ